MAPAEAIVREKEEDSGVGSSISSTEARMESGKSTEGEFKNANMEEEPVLSPGVAALKEVFDVCYTVQLMEEERGMVERLQDRREEMAIAEEKENREEVEQTAADNFVLPLPPRANNGGADVRQQRIIRVQPPQNVGKFNLVLPQNAPKSNNYNERNAGQERQRQHMAVRHQMKQHQAQHKPTDFHLNMDGATLLEKRKRRAAILR
ncbi:uncharacterized protein VTP21DRAFT_3568 [Calcarisporiella thermophila]|uniref:uncharacterized protein n=1 Tax=Calcarisporiella thermophila TaxID=911321 RepID=UPI0037449099